MTPICMSIWIGMAVSTANVPARISPADVMTDPVSPTPSFTASRRDRRLFGFHPEDVVQDEPPQPQGGQVRQDDRGDEIQRGGQGPQIDDEQRPDQGDDDRKHDADVPLVDPFRVVQLRGHPGDPYAAFVAVPAGLPERLFRRLANLRNEAERLHGIRLGGKPDVIGAQVRIRLPGLRSGHALHAGMRGESLRHGRGGRLVLRLHDHVHRGEIARRKRFFDDRESFPGAGRFRKGGKLVVGEPDLRRERGQRAEQQAGYGGDEQRPAHDEGAGEIAPGAIRSGSRPVPPFSLRELATRLRALLRRLRGPGDQPGVLERDNLVISEAKCQVFKDGREIQLTPTEFKILHTLAARPGVVFSRLQLLTAALGNEYSGYERTMDSHIRNLRRKLEDDPANPRYIQTVYGFGYRFGEKA